MDVITVNKVSKYVFEDILTRHIQVKGDVVSYDDNDHKILTDVERDNQFHRLSDVLDKLPLKINSKNKLKELSMEELIFQRAVEIDIIKLGEEMQFRLSNVGHYHEISFDSGKMTISENEIIGKYEDIDRMTTILYMSCAAILCFAKSIRDPHVKESSYVMHQIVHWLCVLDMGLVPEEEKNLYPYTHFYLSPDFLGMCDQCTINKKEFNGALIIDFKNTNNDKNHQGALNKYTPPLISLLLQSGIKDAYIITQELTDNILNKVDKKIADSSNAFFLGSLAIIKICMELLKQSDVKNLLADDRDYKYYHVDIPEVNHVDQYMTDDKDDIIVNFITGIYLNAFDKNLETISKDSINSIIFKILSDECDDTDNKILEKVVLHLKKIAFKKKKYDQDMAVQEYLSSNDRMKDYDDYASGNITDDVKSYIQEKFKNVTTYDDLNIEEVKETIKKNVLLINNEAISLSPETVLAEEEIIDDSVDIDNFVKIVNKSNLTIDVIRDVLNNTITDDYIFKGVEDNCMSIKSQIKDIKSLVKDNDKLDNKLKPSLTPSIWGNKYKSKEIGIPAYNPKSDYSLKANDIEYILQKYQDSTYTKIPESNRRNIPTYNMSDRIIEIQYICDQLIENMELHCSVQEFISNLNNEEFPELSRKILELDQGPYTNSFYYKEVFDKLGIELDHAIDEDLSSDVSFILETKHASMCDCHSYNGNQTVSAAIVNNIDDLYNHNADYYKEYISESALGSCDLYESLRKIAVLYQHYSKNNDQKLSIKILSFLENYDGRDVSDILLMTRRELMLFLPDVINVDDNMLKKTVNQNPFYKKIDDDVLRRVMNVGIDNYNVEHTGTKHPNCILGMDYVERFLNIINNIDDDDFMEYLKNIQRLWNHVIMDASRVGIGIDRYVIKHIGNTYYMFNKSNNMYRLLLIYDLDDIKNFLGVETSDEIRLFFGEALITDKIVAIRYNMTDADIYTSMRALSYFYIWREYETSMNIPAVDRRYKFITLMSLKNRFYTCEFSRNLRYFIPNITQDLNNIANLFLDKLGPVKDLHGNSVMKFNSYDMITTTLFSMYETYIDKVLDKYSYRDDVQILYGLKSIVTEDVSLIQEIIELPEEIRHAVLYNGCELNKSNITKPIDISAYKKYKFVQSYSYDIARKKARVSIENIRLYFFNPKYSVQNERMFTDFCMTYHFEYGGSQSYTSAAKDLIGKLIKYQDIFTGSLNKENFYTLRGLYKVFESIKSDMNAEMDTKYNTWVDAFLSNSRIFYTRFMKKFIMNGGYVNTSDILKLDPFSMVLFTKKTCDDYKLPKFDMSFIKTDLFSMSKNKSMSNDSIEHFYEPRSDKFQEFIIKNPDKAFENIIDLQKNVLFTTDEKGKSIAFVPNDRLKSLKDCQLLVLKFGTKYVNNEIEGYKLEMQDYYKICYLFRRSKRKIRLNNMVHLVVLSTIDKYFSDCGIYKLAANIDLSEEEKDNLYKATGYDLRYNTSVDIEELESDILKSKVTLVSVVRGMCNFRFVFQVAFKDETGGNREFYIVNFPARLCIGFLDKVFSYYCTKCPNEFISVPGNKKMNVINHLISEVSKNDDANHTTVLMSCDCSKWSNKAVMLEYQLIIATMYNVGIFDSLLFDTLMNIIIKIQNKWMEVPKEYIHNKETNLKKFFYYMGEYYMRLSSTWGQGQINYLSSFKHAIVANMIKFILCNDDDVFYSMVHSDDSAYIFQTPEIIPRQVLANRVVHSVALCYSLFNQTVNTKKTSIGGFMEFCSTFYTYKSSNIGLSRLVRIEYTPSIANPMIDFVSYFSKIRIWFNEGVPLNLLKLLLDAMKFIWLLWYKPCGASPVTGNPTAIDVYDCIYGDIIYSFKTEEYLINVGIDPKMYYAEYLCQINNPDTEIVDNKLFQLLRLKSDYNVRSPITPKVMQDEIACYDSLTNYEMKKFTNVTDLEYIHEIHPEFDILEVPENVKGFKIFGIFDNYANKNFIDSFNNRDNRSKFVERFRLNSHLYINGLHIKKFLSIVHNSYDIKLTYTNVWEYIRNKNPNNELVNVHADKHEYACNMREAIESGNYIIMNRNDQSQELYYCRKQTKQLNNHLSKSNILAIIYANDIKMYRIALHSEIIRGLYPEKPEFLNIQKSISEVDYSTPIKLKRTMKKLVYLLTIGKDYTSQTINPFNSDQELYLTLNVTIKVPIRIQTSIITILNKNLRIYKDYIDPSIKFQVDSGVFSINGTRTEEVSKYMLRCIAYIGSDILVPHDDIWNTAESQSITRKIENKLDTQGMRRLFVESSRHWKYLYNKELNASLSKITQDKITEIDEYYKSSYAMSTDTVKTYIFKDYHQYTSMGENMKYYINDYNISDQFSGVIFGVNDLSYTYYTNDSYIALHFYLNINIMGLPCSAFTASRYNPKNFVISLLTTHMRSYIKWVDIPSISGNFVVQNNKAMMLYNRYVVTLDYDIFAISQYQLVICMKQHFAVLCNDILFYSIEHNIKLSCPIDIYDPLKKFDVFIRSYCDDQIIISKYLETFGKRIDTYWYNDISVIIDENFIYKSAEYVYQVNIDLLSHEIPSLDIKSTKYKVSLNKNMQSLLISTANAYNKNKETYKNWVTIINFILKGGMDSLYYKNEVNKYIKYNIKRDPVKVDKQSLTNSMIEENSEGLQLLVRDMLSKKSTIVEIPEEVNTAELEIETNDVSTVEDYLRKVFKPKVLEWSADYAAILLLNPDVLYNKEINPDGYDELSFLYYTFYEFYPRDKLETFNNELVRLDEIYTIRLYDAQKFFTRLKKKNIQLYNTIILNDLDQFPNFLDFLEYIQANNYVIVDSSELYYYLDDDNHINNIDALLKDDGDEHN